MTDSVKVEIPKELYHALEKKVEGSSFTSVSELVQFILQQFLELEATDKPIPFSDEEKKELHERFRRLGYE